MKMYYEKLLKNIYVCLTSILINIYKYFHIHFNGLLSYKYYRSNNKNIWTNLYFLEAVTRSLIVEIKMKMKETVRGGGSDENLRGMWLGREIVWLAFLPSYA